MSPASRLSLLAPALGIALALSGCSGPDERATPPVATPSLTMNRTQAPLGSPLEMTFRFDVAEDAPALEAGYRVLVHFVDENGELMWTDDHAPLVPTSAWKAGESVEYTRTTFIPIYPYIGPATVQVGLYHERDEQRLPLTGEDTGQRAYPVGTLELLPQSENVFLIYKDGWHRAEVAQDNAAVEWQWTRQLATITFRNPRQDSTFYLEIDGRPDVFEEPQRVTVRSGGEVLDEFLLESEDPQIRKIPIGANQLGTEDMAELQIEVDKTFVPSRLPGASPGDDRELGVRVFHAFLEPHGTS